MLIEDADPRNYPILLVGTKVLVLGDEWSGLQN